MYRRTLLQAAILSALIPAMSFAANWPDGKPVRVLVGYAAGGPTDTQARTIANALAAETGSTVIVENMPGASGTIALRQVIDAAPDGYTMLYTIDGPLTQLPHSMKDLGYDPLKDVTPITRTSMGGSVLLVHESIPAKDLESFVDYAKQNKGKLSYASYGIGTLAHIYGEVLSNKLDLDLTHVPYKGSADAMRDLVAGRVHIMFDSPATSLQFVEKGQLKRIGSTGETRRDLLPELPTLGEQGLEGFEVRSFNGFYGPAGIPDDVRERMNDAIHRATRSDSVKRVWEAQGFEHIYEQPADFEKAYHTAYETWGTYIKQIGITMN